MNRRIFFLSWTGAVLLPSIFCFVSLICATLGTNVDSLFPLPQVQNLATQSFIVICLVTISTGTVILFIVLNFIDSAAKNIPSPKFSLYFSKTMGQTIKVNDNELTDVRMTIRNIGEDMAQNIETYMHFPPSFKISESQYYELSKDSPTSKVAPNYTCLYRRNKNLHIETFTKFTISFSASTLGNYKIPTTIYERKTGKTEISLSIDVA